MLASVIFIGLLSLCAAQRGTESADNPGLNLYLKANFFQSLKNDLVPLFDQTLTSFNVEGISQSVVTGLFSANFTVTRAWFSDVGINEQNTGITFPKTINQVRFAVDNISAKFNLDYDISTKPPFLVDKGSGYAAMTNFNFSVVLELYDDPQGRLRVRAQDVVLTLNKDAFDFSFAGSSSVSKFLGYVAKDLNALLSSSLFQKVSPLLENAIVAGIDAQLSSIPYQAQIPNTPIYVDYRLTSPPYVTMQGLGLEHNGTFFKRGSTTRLPGPVKMPTSEDKGLNLQIFLSEYTLNTQFNAIYELGILSTIVTKETVEGVPLVRMDTDFMGISIPEFKQVYNPKREVRLVITAPSRPELTIKQDDMDFNVTVAMDIQVKNESGDGFSSAVVVHFNLTCDLDIAVVGQTLKLKLNTMEYDIYAIDSQIGDVSGKEMNGFFGTAFPFIKNLINGRVKNGFPLPLPSGLSLVDFEVYERPGYLFIESDTKFQLQ